MRRQKRTTGKLKTNGFKILKMIRIRVVFFELLQKKHYRKSFAVKKYAETIRAFNLLLFCEAFYYPVLFQQSICPVSAWIMN